MKKIFLLSLFLAFPVFAASNTSASSSEQAPSAQQINTFENTMFLIEKNYITKVNEQTLMDNALNGMLTKLDPHSSYLTEKDMSDLETTISGQFVGIGVELTTDRGFLKVISPIANSPAAKAGLQPDDMIVKINSNFVQDMSISDAITQIKGKPGTNVKLTVLRKDIKKPLVMNITREMVHVDAVQAKMIAPGYAYVRIAFFQGPVTADLKNAIAKLQKESDGHLKGFILDLRNNPGGLLDVSAEVLDLFLNKKETDRYHNLAVYTKGRMPNSNLKYYLHDQDMIPNVPMITIINGGSASASEIVAGALQDYKRSIIIGTRSFGKGSVQTILPVSNNSAIKLTTALYYTPAGREIQARGIEPDVIVPQLTINDQSTQGDLEIDEAAFGNHIQNHNAQDNTEHAKANTKLAKEDYQLNEALTLLKAMHAMQ